MSKRLVEAYGTPDLGNQDDALDEAVYIILSFQTDVTRLQGVWPVLKARFPDWAMVLRARPSALEKVIRPTGLHRARARLIRTFLRAVQRRWGELSLKPLERLTDRDVEAELMALPGLAVKAARCVMLYALGRRVLPVDSNTFRFMQRFGVLDAATRYRRKVVHDQIQAIVPPALRYDLHVNLLVHGQRTCVPKEPRCPVCPVAGLCKYGGERLRSTRMTRS